MSVTALGQLFRIAKILLVEPQKLISKNNA